ncbi:MAG: hypothetical protein IJH12_01320 [Clostridia bacterium]|nr:hypothetical protein [Clostridia bacterium]
MLNTIWPFFILISIFFSFISGNIESLNESIYSSTKSAIDVVITLIGSTALWSGLIKIVSNTRIITWITNIMNPIIDKLFPESKKNEKVRKLISMNIISNFLGIGNAATPIGLKAIDVLNKENKEKAHMSNSMMMLILINTASIQLIPTTIFAIRQSLGSNDPFRIILPVWGATIIAAYTGIVVLKNFFRKRP